MPWLDGEDNGKVAWHIGRHCQWRDQNVQMLCKIFEDEGERKSVGDLETLCCDGRYQGCSAETWKGYMP